MCLILEQKLNDIKTYEKNSVYNDVDGRHIGDMGTEMESREQQQLQR